jgi:hypothetical protein
MQHQHGYIAVRLTEECVARVVAWQRKNKLENEVQAKDLHVTLAASKRAVAVIHPDDLNDVSDPNDPHPQRYEEQQHENAKQLVLVDHRRLGTTAYRHTYKLEVWSTSHNLKCLVLCFQCEELLQRVAQTRECGASFEFRNAQLHLSLCYDFRPASSNPLKGISFPNFDLEFAKEYSEPYDENWTLS